MSYELISMVFEWGNHVLTFIGMTYGMLAFYKVGTTHGIVTKVRASQKLRGIASLSLQRKQENYSGRNGHDAK